MPADAIETATHHGRPGYFAILPKLLPELAMAGIAAATLVVPECVPAAARDSLTFVALVELFFCMAQGTLTDIATRLRARPPWWAVAGLCVGLVALNPDILTVLRAVFREGWPVFLPFLWSTLERLRELWTMPAAPRIEKLRRRALVAGRMGLVVGVGFTALGAAGITIALGTEPAGFDFLRRTAGGWLALAFGAAAYDVVRVHRAAFAARPRALLPRFDALGVNDLDPL